MDLDSVSADLDALRGRALAAIGAATDLAELEAVELSVLGRKQGELTAILRGIGALSGEDRPRVGALANDLRLEIEAALASRRERLEGIALEVRLAAERLDPTLPGRPLRRGSLHPIARDRSRDRARSSASSAS